eukprot:TRINITY_DN102919_c0_g1_i1.p1 TRINITY_DN102919_c0_g1~~TRINITY_DN102919_c0_g1_i1.p1  ORF type:complete len:254 (-),score=34.21 TRINITY_DN102919_c0_g1_i1:26-787(-)
MIPMETSTVGKDGGYRQPIQTDSMSPEDAEGFNRMMHSLTDWRFRDELRSFVRQNCNAFVGAEVEVASGGGYSHACHDIHLKYKALFDSHVERFLSSEGIDVREFLEFAHQASSAPAELRAGWNGFLAEITASEDYDRFAKLMCASAAQQQREGDEAKRSFELPEVPAQFYIAEPACVAAAESVVVTDAQISHDCYHYCATDGLQHGPVSLQDLRRCWRDGLVAESCYIFFPGLTNWVALGQMPDLLALVSSS